MTIITAFILTWTLNAQSQTDSTNIYLRALSGHLQYLIEFNQERPDLIKIPDTYYIEKDWIATDNFPTEIDGQKIEILTRDDIIKKVKGDTSITLLAVRPVQWKNGKMEIHVIEFKVSGNKRNLNYVNQMNGSSFRIKCTSNSESIDLVRIEK
ncbi:MAG: hypothetical protein WD077_08710 [Bacteroidia bacterium]